MIKIYPSTDSRIKVNNDPHAKEFSTNNFMLADTELIVSSPFIIPARFIYRFRAQEIMYKMKGHPLMELNRIFTTDADGEVAINDRAITNFE